MRLIRQSHKKMVWVKPFVVRRLGDRFTSDKKKGGSRDVLETKNGILTLETVVVL